MNDQEIIDLFLQRNEDAIKHCELQYGAYCFTIANNILGNQSDTEECLNSTWLKAWETIPPTIPHHFRQYLSTITRNTAFNTYRTQHRKKRGDGNISLVLDELEECLSSSVSVEKEIEDKELGNTINHFVKELPQPARSIFVRRYYFADSAKTIAKQFNMSESNVNVILHRSRLKLKKQLISEGYEHE